MLLMNLFRGHNRHAQSVRRVVLQIERLEGRETPANLTVNTGDDTHLLIPPNPMKPGGDRNGNVSLRSAIEYANMIGGQSTIGFAPNALISLSLNQELILDANITISGAAVVERPSGQNVPRFRIFEIKPNRTCVLSGLELRRGSLATEYGGAIYNAGNLTTYGLSVHHNDAEDGGGVYNRGWMSMTGGQIFENYAESGGGIANESGGNLILQGGIQIDHNVAGGAPGVFAGGLGGGIYNGSGSFCTAYGATITYNQSLVGVGGAGGDGGGVFNFGSIALNSGQLSNNLAGRDGGGIFTDGTEATFFNTIIADNSAARDGGGFCALSGLLSLDQTTVVGNSAGTGPGGYVDLSAVLYDDHGNNYIIDLITFVE